MLSAFPQFFNYSVFAIAGLRIFFGLWFVLYGYSIVFGKGAQGITIPFKQLKNTIATISFLAGLFTIVGLFTQIDILVALLILLLKWHFDIRAKGVVQEVFIFDFYIAIIGIALLFMGPGVPAIDLPL